MSERLPRISWKECERILRQDGWYQVRQTGAHHHYAHPAKTGVVTIPERDTLALPVLKSVIKQAGLTNEEFIRLARGRRGK